ncbi:FAD-dependent monooxygenase [Embleya sp. NPDC059237]|uniref:FAD-dependent monooxygenase n=1 Tax=Embleya sp. NPDC059237 TaxID=3346784 RepID=UPI003696199E
MPEKNATNTDANSHAHTHANHPTARSAVVVGGGIGGLAVAVGLRRIGWRVTVLERKAVGGEVGAGIALMSNAMRALESLGLGPAVKAGGRPQLSTGVRDGDGRWLSQVDGTALEAKLGTGIYSLHRAELHDILRGALPADCGVVTGAEVTDITQDPNRALVHYTGPGGTATIGADLAVVADGVNSRVRARLWPDAPAPVYSGSTVWRGVTTEAFVPTPDIAQTLHDGAEIGVMPIRDGRVCWHMVTKAKAGVRHDNEWAEVWRRLDGLHDPIPALLKATAPEAVLHHDIHILGTPLDTYVAGRVALLGDAAHAMPPHLGQGACMAIEDAVVLAACLHTHQNQATALATYDKTRRPRVAAVTKASHRMGRIQKAEGRLAVAMRNTAMRLTPPAVAMKAILKFADWTPPRIPLSDTGTTA